MFQGTARNERSGQGSTGKDLVFLHSLFFVLLTGTPSIAAAAGGWQFSWSDEFTGPAIDVSVWGYENGYVRNSELQYYTNRPENARIDSGTLLIQARRDNWNGHQYTAASLRTMGKKSWLYGRFEMRAKIDIRSGSWPAWWWLPNSGGWPRGGEIDMMEFYRGMCLFNVMDGNQKWSSVTRTVSSLGGDRWAQQYHVWTWEWDSTNINLYLDGALMNHYAVANADGTGPGGANPFRLPGYMLVNQAIGGTNGGDPSATPFPVDYRVDWIRVHTWSSQAAHTLTVTNGAGSGPYVAGTQASITAKLPQTGQTFDQWVVAAGSAVIDSPASPAALLTMPMADVTVTATYRAGTAVSSASDLRMVIREKTGTPLMVVYDIRGRKIAPVKLFARDAARGVYLVIDRSGQSRQMVVMNRQGNRIAGKGTVP